MQEALAMANINSINLVLSRSRVIFTKFFALRAITPIGKFST